MEAAFLQAFKGENKTVPVWFMRQAGRYLPEYQALKKKHALQEMFCQPELAAEVTCQPVDILGVDAAILFADILTLPSAMGFEIHFDSRKGPVIQLMNNWRQAHDFEGLDYVAGTIRLARQRLPASVPLIGFAGAPFTVLTYLIEGGSSLTYARTFRFLQEQPEAFDGLMRLLTKNTVAYLRLQRQAGIQAVQIFDSWAGILPAVIFARRVLPFVREIFDALEGLPSIYFCRGSAHLWPYLIQSGADVLSVDHTVALDAPWIRGMRQGLQGNLFNGLLYADHATLSAAVHQTLEAARWQPRYIFNLSHGVMPDMDVEKLKAVVRQVHAYPWKEKKREDLALHK